VTVGQRLKEERKRLGFTQSALAVIGQTTRKSQIDYENDTTQPKSGYLAAIARLGADVQYIITGQKNPTALSADEEELIAHFRAAPLAVKAAAIGALQGAAATMKMERNVNIGAINALGGHVMGNMTVING